MDPVTQGVIGALAAQTVSCKTDLAKASVIGGLAAMAPDLDVLIRSSTDTLLALEFHRHFTHSLAFAPVGGLICALFLQFLLGSVWRLQFKQTLSWCLIGYATHGLLDAFTSYGTQLLWPLSNTRFAWDVISVIDLSFTLPLLLLMVFVARLKNKHYLAAAGVWGCLYMGLGYVQHERAITLGNELVAERGHQSIRLEAKPSFSNIVVWKVIYETATHFHVDAIKPGLLSATVWEGSKIPKLNVKRDLAWLDFSSQQAKDIQRFAWFSAGYVALDPHDSMRIIDVRYSMLPHQIKPLWGIELSADSAKDDYAQYYTQRGDAKSSLVQMLQMVFAD